MIYNIEILYTENYGDCGYTISICVAFLNNTSL